MAQPHKDWQALDVATGGGHTALRFAPFVRGVVATDITATMLLKAKTFITGQGANNVTFARADAEDLPFSDSSFELVTCRIAPHHFADCLRFVREGARVLKPGGKMLVQDHALPEDPRAARYIDLFEQLRDPSHNRAYSQSEWIEMFLDAGLAVEYYEQIVKQHRFIPWAERQGCTSRTLEQLICMVDQAPAIVTEWMQPSLFGTPEAAFVNHHILIQGRKSRACEAQSLSLGPVRGVPPDRC
jgi:ubiquinone/menaquinone biosynthesis C-methylase UbiE